MGHGMTARNISIGVFLAAALALSACLPDSINPLGDPASATPDPKLAGRWTGTMNGEATTLAITAKDGAILEFRVETTDADGKKEWVVLEGFPAMVAKRSYMNVKFREEQDKIYDPAEENFYLCRYEIGSDGGLTVWTMAEQPTVDAIADGRVNGAVDPAGGERTIHITDSSLVLRALVEESNPGILFATKYATFRRAPD